MGLGNHHSAASGESLDLDKDGTWMRKPLGEKLLGHGIWT